MFLFLERINCHCPRFNSVQVSHSLQPHRLQFTRFPYPSPAPGACSNSCPLSRWCHPTIPSSVVPFSSRLQSFPASGSFPMSQEKILAPGYGDKITCPCDFFFICKGELFWFTIKPLCLSPQTSASSHFRWNIFGHLLYINNTPPPLGGVQPPPGPHHLHPLAAMSLLSNDSFTYVSP